ncbi:von willebrand factor type A domain protein (macronuclear) [Tetrahymena thermophila SB210]|uniref:von willebrand factor type A domain protein n=1 Tax=Tetrahymena thermophila (strain SB210) TaxID=312017 RepID=I7LT27_TETTS|nr:von willebrand factor type A domain protein [Tetrahymena thermophila SB210]EAR84127.2 von willebrand factor type A domain protein [Tetrahymena thermophila SB210]|eukprot:XP_001031790.2 von willebrand factor type A domain protein [Tetrahymena thermophila SB210]
MLNSFKSRYGLFNNHNNLTASLSKVNPNGSTRLRDSITGGIATILKMNGDLITNYGVTDRHFLHIIITDGEDTSSKNSLEDLGQLMRVLGQKIPKQMISNHFIGIDMNRNSKEAAELLALSILGGDTSYFHLASSQSIKEIFNRIQAQCGIITQFNLQALLTNNAGFLRYQERQRGFINLSVKKFIVIFNLDISGSMSGPRWNQLRTCISQFTQRLTQQDLIAVILFNDKITPLQPMYA